jgi:hypothetical protein
MNGIAISDNVISPAQPNVFPLPKGEGQDEGEGSVQKSRTLAINNNEQTEPERSLQSGSERIQRSQMFSFSPRERARVRGNGAFDQPQILEMKYNKHIEPERSPQTAGIRNPLCYLCSPLFK